MSTEQPSTPELPEDHEADLPWPPPRIYVASLSDYNAGILHGTWLTVDTDADELQQRIDAMLAGSPTTKRYGDIAEEWAIHDYEGWGPLHLSEFEPLERLTTLASGIGQHGPAFAAWVDYTGSTDDNLIEQFEDHYQGEFDSLVDYGEQLLDDSGVNLEGIELEPESFRQYLRIDVEAFVHDLLAGGVMFTIEGDRGIYVFAN
jgi:antirestriction protein